MVTPAADRSVVVTGATSGIGKATALELARAGFPVFGTATTEEKAAALRADAAAAGLDVRTVVFDLADPDATADAFGKVAAATGDGPWAVVNNGGYAQAGAVEDIDDARARHQLEVNLLAPLRIARLVLPSMRRRGEGRIVNMSSFGGLVAQPALGWYTASKFALEGISDVLRVEVAQFGVTVILVEPGGFRSNIWRRGIDNLPSPDGSAYAHLYGLADDMLAHSLRLREPDPVARAVRRALTSPRPRRRYLVGADVRVAALFDTVLPAAAMDYLKSVRTGLRAPRGRVDRLAGKVLSKFL